MEIGNRAERKQCWIKWTRKCRDVRREMGNLVVVEDLEGVVEDGFDDADLPAGVGDVAS